MYTVWAFAGWKLLTWLLCWSMLPWTLWQSITSSPGADFCKSVRSKNNKQPGKADHCINYKTRSCLSSTLLTHPSTSISLVPSCSQPQHPLVCLLGDRYSQFSFPLCIDVLLLSTCSHFVNTDLQWSHLPTCLHTPLHVGEAQQELYVCCL